MRPRDWLSAMTVANLLDIVEQVYHVDMVDLAVIPLGCDPGSTAMPTAVPLYEQLAEEIRTKIRAGELKPGDRLPSTSALKEAGWKQGVIMWAMRTLRAEGWTRGQPGQAVYVADRPPVSRTDESA